MLTIGYALVAVLAQLIHVSLAAEAHSRTDASSSLRLGAGWIRGEKADLSLPVTLEFLLLMPAEVMRQASDALRAASDPASETFGQYWTRNQVTEHFSSSINIQGLLSEFTAMGLPRRRITISLSRSRAYLNTSVAEAEELFNARYYHYVNGDTVQLFSESLHFPEPLSSYVDFVMPSQWKPTKRKPDIRRDRLAGTTEMQIQQSQLDCSKYITPGCLRDIYNITHSGNVSAHPNSSLGIYEPAWATWLADDLDEFFTRFEPSIVGKRPIVQAINGGYLQTDVRGEGLNLEPNLDFQFSLPLAHPVPVTNIQVGDKFLSGTLNTMLGGFDRFYCETATDPVIDPIYPDTKNPGGYNASDCGSHIPPLVISISYTQPEAELPDRYMELQCLEYLKLGLQGITILTASGDRGAAAHDKSCLSRGDGDGRTSPSRFSPNFPASCPWVTVVGGTQLRRRTNGAEASGQTPFPEEETYFRVLPDNVSVSSSGGGFSNIFSVPFYQHEDVRKYMQESAQAAHLQALQHAGYFDSSGRGYPDISGIAANYLVYIDGTLHSVLGTSAPTPVFASMIALVNNIRLHAGKAPVGFINPVLYAFKDQITRDVVTGFNEGCGVREAFPAVEGWDASTGLGSLDFNQLVELYLQLP